MLILGSNHPDLGKSINYSVFLEDKCAAGGVLDGSGQGRTEWSSKLRAGGRISAREGVFQHDVFLPKAVTWVWM